MDVQRVLAQLNEENMEFTFTVTEQEANMIIAGLQELPAKVANPLTRKLQEQAQEQMRKQEAQE
jgi:hypothetical protein